MLYNLPGYHWRLVISPEIIKASLRR
ncbi:MAG: hypothetical protein K0S26_1140, partial [Bacteroidota bacterium]|nr:hypothetical protein [Bacteroidota bacterium]